jgi:UDP-N-acetylmuramoylalanine--D-glutamate ligase
VPNNDFVGKKIAIVGLGKTGIACFNYLSPIAKVFCYDDSYDGLQRFANNFPQASILDLSDQYWANLDYIVVSPGVALSWPSKHPILCLAQKHDISIISDVEILFSNNKQAKFIAITGTNGKSTTTALLAWALKSCGFIAVGNIGKPCLQTPKAEGFVLELSSFQLDLLTNFRPQWAAITNITPDHLDRYPSMQDYINSKLSIAKNMTKADYLLLNIDDTILSKAAKIITHTNVITISLESCDALFYYDGAKIIEHGKEASICLPRTLINPYNILVVYALLRSMGFESSWIQQAIADFPGLDHRLQLVRKIANISIYNDSKATNAVATGNALQVLDNVFWLAGGIPKEGGIAPLLPLAGKIKKAYFFGQAKWQFAKTAIGIDFVLCDNLQQAVALSFDDAQNFASQCNILLSPACSSFDQFKNFEERGEVFINLINQLS